MKAFNSSDKGKSKAEEEAATFKKEAPHSLALSADSEEEEHDDHHHHHHAEDFTSIAFTLLTFIYGALFIYTRNEPFFWDGVMLSSRVAHFFYDNDLAISVLPSAIDAGHPPLFGYLLACLWMVFGKSLLVGHCLVFALSWLVLWQLKELCLYFLPIERAHWGLCLSALLAPWLAHSLQVSPDVALMAFYLSAVMAVLKGKNLLLMLSLLLLSLTSTRGFLLAGGIALIALFMHKGAIRWVVGCILGLVPAMAWYIYHYSITGWMFANPISEWASLYKSTDGLGFFKNILILGFRFLDIGMLPFTALFLLSFLWWKKLYTNKQIRLLYILVVMPVLILSSVLLWKMNGIGMRYLLPSFVVLPIFIVKVYSLKPVYYLSLMAIGFSGNFWIYPDGIAKSWDCSLSFLEVEKAKSATAEWLNSKGISSREVGSYFPFIDAPLYTHLSSSSIPFADSATVGVSPYILYSNVCNEERLPMNFFLPNKYILLYRREENSVFTEVYKLDTINK